MREKGQAILALILIMTVALAIGVSVIQKSLVDLSTSTKVEQSQRAFSAAEAGIERGLRGSSSGISLAETGNQSSATTTDTGLIPCVPGSSGCAQGANIQQTALEYPPIAKEEFAHIWLIDPASTTNPPTGPNSPTKGIEVYWGNPGAEHAAIQIKIIYYDSVSGTYKTAAYYFDSDAARASGNGFTDASTSCTSPVINTIFGVNRTFYCKKTIDSTSSPAFPPSGLMLVRIRLLYTSTSQQIAVQGHLTCGALCSLPPQTRLIRSTGTSGPTQRTVQIFQINNVVLPYFDFAIFSAGAISK